MAQETLVMTDPLKQLTQLLFSDLAADEMRASSYGDD